ncbi:MAG: hypothetical protein KJ601_02810 [Nanoarchaeota archaeon]|nr:hypothetical protein [Nanoarchaeota archaeon]MBU1703755.1 hypothetical protein [Nanoarchaeota archaeon]
MNENIYTKLSSKGWSADEISKADRIFKEAQEKKHILVKFLDEFVYWFVLIVAIIGNTVVSIILVPFLLVFRTAPLYMIVGSIGITFGMLFMTILKDLKELEKREHIVAGVFIPALALVNVYFMVSFANHLSTTIRINQIQHNPVIVSVFYVFMFSLPYMLSRRGKK